MALAPLKRGEVPQRDTTVGVNYKELHPRAAVKNRRRDKTCLLSDASRLVDARDSFLSPLLALGERGNDAAQFVAEALRETPELAAHSVAL